MSEQRDSAGQELEFLEKLSIEDLEALLKTSGSPNDVEAFFDAVIKEVVKREKKEPTGRLPDVDTAWEEIQTRCNQTHLPKSADNSRFVEHKANKTPSFQKAQRKPVHSFALSASKIAAVVALTLLLSFSLMIGVQAFGIDMFGALARWTSDTFHFETQQTEHDLQSDLHASIQTMLDIDGILGEYTPKWYPEQCKITKCQVQDDEQGLFIQVSFSFLDNRLFNIRLDRYNNNMDIDIFTSEKDNAFVEEYISHNRIFHLFSNEANLKGIWSDGETVLSIRGNLTVQELKAIIDSIGG